MRPFIFLTLSVVLALPREADSAEPTPPVAMPSVQSSTIKKAVINAYPYSPPTTNPYHPPSNPARGYGYIAETTPESHLQEAARHLKAAGLEKLAEDMQKRGETALLSRKLSDKRAELKAMREKVSKLESEIRELQAASAAPQQQVMVELKLLEVSLSELRKLGLDVRQGGIGRLLLMASGKNLELNQQQKLAVGLVENESTLTEMIESLQAKGIVKVLSAPNLVTLSGRPASFHTGGEVPIPLPAIDGKTAVEFRRIGLKVDVVTVVREDGRIRLEIRPEFSQLDPTVSNASTGQRHPAIRVQTVDTGFDMKPGQTVAIGGIVKAGKLFDNDSGTKTSQHNTAAKQSELILLATPSLIDQPAKSTAVRLPPLPQPAGIRR